MQSFLPFFLKPMKIDINKISLIPPHIGEGFCAFGKLDEELKVWVEFHNFHIKESGKFTNIEIPDGFDLSECFLESEQYDYVDGFSPNLNKNLHIGHLSNFIIANAFQSMGIGKKYIAILGDTLSGDVPKKDAQKRFEDMNKSFGYNVDQVFFASQIEYKGDLLMDGEGDYKGTKIFDLGEEKIVGIKSDGSTSYFYQDVGLAHEMGGKGLYLTGFEQKEHFNNLKKLFPDIHHIGLGLVLMDGKKQSSRDGNIIYIHEVLEMLLKEFGDNVFLCYNILAGQILKSVPSSTKDINMKMLKNVKTSGGLYMSYTTARLKSAGVKSLVGDRFLSSKLAYNYFKAKNNKSTNTLFAALVDHCKKINQLYSEKRIQGNKENEIMFALLLFDLELGMKKLGMFVIDKV